jgi:hypothetical protein
MPLSSEIPRSGPEREGLIGWRGSIGHSLRRGVPERGSQLGLGVVPAPAFIMTIITSLDDIKSQ